MIKTSQNHLGDAFREVLAILATRREFLPADLADEIEQNMRSGLAAVGEPESIDVTQSVGMPPGPPAVAPPPDIRIGATDNSL